MANALTKFFYKNVRVRKKNIRNFLKKHAKDIDTYYVISNIERIEDENEKLELIDEYYDENQYYDNYLGIFFNMVSEENKFKLLDILLSKGFITEENYFYRLPEILNRFEDKNEKERALNTILSKLDIEKIRNFRLHIRNMYQDLDGDENFKLELFKKFNSSPYSIFFSLNEHNELNDDEMINYYEKLKNDDKKQNAYLLFDIIERLNDSNKKMDLIHKNKDLLLEGENPNLTNAIIKIVSSLEDDDNKIEIIDIFKNRIYHKEITETNTDWKLMSGSDDEIENIYEILFNTITSDDKKIELLNILKNKNERRDERDSGKIYKGAAYINFGKIDDEDITTLFTLMNDYSSKTKLVKENIELFDSFQYDIKIFDNKEFQELYLNRIKDKISDYSEDKRDLYISITKYLMKSNENIISTLNYELFSENFLRIFRDKDGNYPALQVIGRYKEIQESIIEIYNHNPKLCTCLLKNMINEEYDYTRILNDVTRRKRLLLSLNSDSINNMSDEDINNLAKKIIQINSNFYDLNSIYNHNPDIKDILNIDTIANNYANRLLETSNNIDDIKNATLIKLYGIDYITAQTLIQKYGFDIKSIETYGDIVYDKIKVILSDIYNIVNETDVRQLRALARQEKRKVEFNSTVVLEAACRKMYGNQLSRSLTKAKTMKKVLDKGTKCSQDVLLAFDEDKKENFNILLTSLGAYTPSYTRPDNYMTDWMRPKMGTHGFCTSLISNQMMGIARVKYVVLGFDTISPEALLLQGPYDLHSSNIDMDITTDSAYGISKYLSPKAMIDNTRHTHNELVIERLTPNGKLKPNYTVFMTEEYDKEMIMKYEQVSEEDLKIIEEANRKNSYIDVPGILKKYNIIDENSTEKEIKDAALQCQIWVNTVQASNDFGIPIVVVERKKVREHERAIVDKMMQEFKNTHDASLLIDMLIRFENNRAGCRDYYVCTGFDIDDANKMMQDIYTEIDKLISNNEVGKAQTIINKLNDWIRKEQVKNENSNKDKDKNILGFDVNEFEKKLENYRESLYEIQKNAGGYIRIMEIGNIDYRKEIGEIKEFGIKETRESSSPQYSIEDIESRYSIVEPLVQLAIQDETRKGSYNFDSKSHGERHIQDVILFTALVGHESLEGENKNNLMKLSMEASKYHDCGRENDINRGHAEAGAIKSYNILKESGEYTPLELAIIYTAIYEHEFRSRTYSVEDFKRELAEASEKKFKDTFISIIKTGNPEEKVEYTEEEYISAMQDKEFVGDMKTDDIINDVLQVVTLVRDADALDRTRFLDSSRACLNPQFLSDKAKKYTNFAFELAEYHSTIDLERMKAEGQIDEEQIAEIKKDPSAYIGKKVEFKITTNKELIKFIRDNNLYMEGVELKPWRAKM